MVSSEVILWPPVRTTWIRRSTATIVFKIFVETLCCAPITCNVSSERTNLVCSHFAFKSETVFGNLFITCCMEFKKGQKTGKPPSQFSTTIFVWFISYLCSYHQQMHFFITHIKCYNIQLKYLMIAPTSFGPFGPSSGSLCRTLLKLQFCANIQ